MAEPTWAIRERPILEAIAAGEHEGPVPEVDDLVELTGLERTSVALALRGLVDAHYVTAVDFAGTLDPDADFADIRLLERGRRAVGQWPSEDAGDALLALLRDRAEEAPTEEERGRLKRFADAASALGTKALNDLAVSWVKHYAGPGG